MQIVNVSLMTVDKCQLRNVQIVAICEMPNQILFSGLNIMHILSA